MQKRGISGFHKRAMGRKLEPGGLTKRGTLVSPQLKKKRSLERWKKRIARRTLGQMLVNLS